MKNIFKLLFGALMLTTAFTACEKDENKISYEGGTPPVLTANKTTAIPLTYLTRDDEAVKFMWTNPEYKFTTGINSQDVKYQLEIGKDGANFSGAHAYGISNDLSRTFTQTEFNDVLLNKLLLPHSVSAFVQVRIKSFLATNALVLYSNVMRFQVTPYQIPPKVTPPPSGELYIVGNATPGDWNNPVPVPSQKFTRISPTLFEITIPIIANNSYLFLPVNGSWNDKYGYIGGNNANNPNGDDFRYGGGDMKAPPVGGNYKIQVDFQRGVFTLTKL